MTQPNLLLLSATEAESRDLVDVLVNRQHTMRAGKVIIQGEFADKQCRLVNSGI